MRSTFARVAPSSLLLLSLAASACTDTAAGGEPNSPQATTAAAETGLTGLYRVAPDHLVALNERPPGGTLTDFETGMQRGLAPDGPDAYLVGAGARSGPTEYRLVLARDADGAVTSFTLEPVGGAPERSGYTATRCCPFRAEEHRFVSEGLRLAGTLFIPESAGPHPAAVWVHGSGPVDRRSAGSWPLFMLSQGFAVLAVDKRGVGESEGDYRLDDGSRDNYPHMRRRSLDVAAAVRSLAAHPEIAVDRIGLIGGSQAGWVIPMAANLGGVAFTITISGGATPVDVEGRFSDLAGEDTDGGSGMPLAEVYRRLADYRPRGFDFRDELAALESPGLWLYGDNDRVNPTLLAVEVLEGVKRDHGKDFTIVRWPDGNHGLQVSVTGDIPEMSRLGQLVPGLHDTVAGWLREKGLAGG